jgi:hypothetical protein
MGRAQSEAVQADIVSRLRLSMRMGAFVGLRPPIRSFRLTANWLRFPRTAPAGGVAFCVQNGKRFKKGLKKIG